MDVYVELNAADITPDEHRKPEVIPLSWANADDMAVSATAPNFIVNNILESASHGILFGDSMSFKTFATLRLIHSICTGAEFFGNEVFKAGKVLYVCGEGKGALARRIKALSLTSGDFKGNFHVLNNQVSVDDAGAMALIGAAITEINPVLIVFDTFSSLTLAAEENSNVDVSNVLRLIKDSSGLTASSIIVHHTGKSSNAGMRGASAFRSNVDFAFEMVREPDSMLSTLSCKKMKDGENFRDISMMGEVVDIELVRQDQEATTSLVMIASTEGATNGGSKNRLDALHEKIYISLIDSVNKFGIDTPPEIVKRYPDSPHLCPKKVVNIEDFRQFGYAHLNVAESSRRKTLKRCIEKLELLNKAFFYNGYLWHSP